MQPEINKLRILLISPNQEKFPCPIVPIGILEIASMLNSAGICFEFLDLCFASGLSEALGKKIIEFRPDVLIVSIRNVDNETFLNQKFYLEEIKSALFSAKTLQNFKLILGGIGVSLYPKETIQYLQANYGFVGFEKSRLLNLLQLIAFDNEDNECLNKIEGLYYTSGSEVLAANATKKDFIWSFDKDWDSIFKLCPREYFTYVRDEPFPPIFSLKTKHGCPFNCIHCKIPQIEGNEVQSGDVGEIIQTLTAMKSKFNVSRVFFSDNIFNIPYDHAAAICQGLIKLKLGISWTCYLHPENIDANLITLMKSAGCYSVQFGIDTASTRLIELWGKNYSIKALAKAISLCRDQKLMTFVSLIIGGWKETEKTLLESLSVLNQIKPGFIWGAFGVRIYSNTQLAEHSIREKIIEKSDNLLRPKFYLSKDVKENGLNIIRDFKKANPSFSIKLNNGIVI